MKTLYLLRHAKALAGGPSDEARELNDRGQNDAEAIGHYLHAQGISPELVLCSPSMRTRQTLELIRPSFARPPRATFPAALYLATPKHITQVIENEAGEAASVMVIGHNPGLHEVAAWLAGQGEPKMIQALHEHFPTTALAVIAVPDWQSLTGGGGLLVNYLTPNSLKACA